MFISIHTTLFYRCAEFLTVEAKPAGIKHLGSADRYCSEQLLPHGRNYMEGQKQRHLGLLKVLGAKGLSKSRGHKALVRREASPSTGHTRVRKRETRSFPLSKCLYLHCLRMQVTFAWPWTLPQLFLNIILGQIPQQKNPNTKIRVRAIY